MICANVFLIKIAREKKQHCSIVYFSWWSWNIFCLVDLKLNVSKIECTFVPVLEVSVNFTHTFHISFQRIFMELLSFSQILLKVVLKLHIP